MSRIDELAREARERGIRPWIAVKDVLAQRVVRVVAHEDGVVLQGGAALHLAYGSPRLSADVDFVGDRIAAVLGARGPDLAQVAGETLECAAAWSLRRSGKLLRGKITLEIDRARRLVMPVEAYEVPAYRPRDLAIGSVEAVEEIAADKIVASAARLAERGAVKTRDLYDLWYVLERLHAVPPPPDLVAAKMRDYGYTPGRGDPGVGARAVSPEEMRASLEGVLPVRDLNDVDLEELIRVSSELLSSYRDVV